MIQLLTLAVVGVFGGGNVEGVRLIRELLKLSAKKDYQQESRFFAVLKELAQKQDQHPSNLLTYQTGKNRVGHLSGGNFGEGRAVLVNAGKRRFVIVVLEIKAAGPAEEIQQVILMDESGQILDKIACAMSFRYGRLQTDVKDKPEDDQAQIIIRVTHHSGFWHAWHLITYQNRAYTFFPQSPPKEEIKKPTEWSQKGLCRIAIRDGKFLSVFPKLEKPDVIE